MSMEPYKVLRWSEIDTAPETSGVYAWYSRLAISKADVAAIIKNVKEAQHKGEREARQIVEEALDRFVFGPFRESPYQVTLRGPLKPKYSGPVEHEPAKSESLVGRLASDPERLRPIADILKGAAPWFTAPLYIGMAIDLRQRLRQHRDKISQLREHDGNLNADDSYEAGFARQVVARNFDPTNLFVFYTEIEVESSEHNDIENLLNRINFPIFGRN